MIPSELPRPYPLQRLLDGQAVSVAADASECAGIARRLLVPSVEALRCEWTLRPDPQGVVAAEGRLHALLHRECVVTLDPFPVEVTESFTVRFVPAGQESDAADDPDAPDELPYEGGVLQLGEATVEQLALALDPYPRKPGAALPEDAGGAPGGPFDMLAGRFRPE